MKNISARFITPAIIGLILVVPFMIMELINRPGVVGDFPIALFLFLWALPVVFILVMIPITRSWRKGIGFTLSPAKLLFRLASLVLIAWIWISIIVDQFPCFLGVQNCD